MAALTNKYKKKSKAHKETAAELAAKVRAHKKTAKKLKVRLTQTVQERDTHREVRLCWENRGVVLGTIGVLVPDSLTGCAALWMSWV